MKQAILNWVYENSNELVWNIDHFQTCDTYYRTKVKRRGVQRHKKFTYIFDIRHEAVTKEVDRTELKLTILSGTHYFSKSCGPSVVISNDNKIILQIIKNIKDNSERKVLDIFTKNVLL